MHNDSLVHAESHTPTLLFGKEDLKHALTYAVTPKIYLIGPCRCLEPISLPQSLNLMQVNDCSDMIYTKGACLSEQRAACKGLRRTSLARILLVTGLGN